MGTPRTRTKSLLRDVRRDPDVDMVAPERDGVNMGKQSTAMLSSRIQWRLRVSTCPNEVPVPGYAGWSLVTPMGRARFTEPDPTLHLDRARGAGYVDVDDEVILASDQLVLRHSDARPVPEEMDAVINTLLARLRHVSHQATIPRTYEGFTGGGPLVPFGEECRFLDATRLSGWHLRSDLLATAVTEEHLRQLGAAKPEDRVHVDVMLDALLADHERDFRRTILYCAIAVEVCAQGALQDAFETVLVEKSERHRVISRPKAGGGSESKDPIYDGLSRRDAPFKTLLHERPLYVQRRSLLQENEPLYQRAVKLYETRNKIMHLGTHDDDTKYLPISREGASAAIDTAIETLAWFGDDGPYVPARDLVAVEGNILKRE